MTPAKLENPNENLKKNFCFFSERALAISSNNTEQAMEWLLAHVDEDVPAALVPTPATEGSTEMKVDESSGDGGEGSAAAVEAKSIKCEDCGRLFKTSLEVEFHATKSGHANFSESTEEKKPLTEEEKKAQMKLIEEKIAKKRVEREEKEKQEALEKERIRIKSGKDMTEIRRKMEEDEMKKIVSKLMHSGGRHLHKSISCFRSTNANVRKPKKKPPEIVLKLKSNLIRLPVGLKQAKHLFPWL